MTIVNVPEALLTALRQKRSFLITSHINPDGDAVGSSLGLSRLLHKLGKSNLVWHRDVTPKLYRALPSCDRIYTGEAPPKGFPEAFDAAIVLECPSLDRTGLDERLPALDLINIDHHLGNQQYGMLNWVEPSAPAVGEMVFRVGRALNLELDGDTANALYLTLVTDTGGFRFSNTSPEAFDTAAALVRSGASPETVSRWLYESNPEAVLRLLGELLQTLELHADGAVATVWLSQEMIQRVGAGPGDTEGLIDYPRSIEGVSAVAFLRELPSGEFKISLRSRGDVDVERIARSNGGGGHRNAAGFTSSPNPRREALVSEIAAALAVAVREDLNRR